jgi:NTP pyrophosphatase (non-canonical NTP hydrolase)
MDIQTASTRALHIRGLYHQLEERHEGTAWTPKDDMLGLVNDIGALSRLVMAAEGRWIPDGDLGEQTVGKLAECLWWVLVIAHRLGVDLDNAFDTTMIRIQTRLDASLARTDDSGA